MGQLLGRLFQQKHMTIGHLLLQLICTNTLVILLQRNMEVCQTFLKIYQMDLL